MNQPRPDVARVTGRAAALDSGFELDTVAPPRRGTYRLIAEAHTRNGWWATSAEIVIATLPPTPTAQSTARFCDMICDSSIFQGLLAVLIFVPLAFVAALVTIVYALVQLGGARRHAGRSDEARG